MTSDPPRSWLQLTRRKLLGGLFVGAGSLLYGVGMRAYGNEATWRGRGLLNRIPDFPPGLKSAVEFPLIEVLHGRRARRFSAGSEIAGGPLAYKSEHKPLPLTALEQMMVLTSVA